LLGAAKRAQHPKYDGIGGTYLAFVRLPDQMTERFRLAGIEFLEVDGVELGAESSQIRPGKVEYRNGLGVDIGSQIDRLLIAVGVRVEVPLADHRSRKMDVASGDDLVPQSMSGDLDYDAGIKQE
jgi:hypothetical protein